MCFRFFQSEYGPSINYWKWLFDFKRVHVVLENQSNLHKGNQEEATTTGQKADSYKYFCTSIRRFILELVRLDLIVWKLGQGLTDGQTIYSMSTDCVDGRVRTPYRNALFFKPIYGFRFWGFSPRSYCAWSNFIFLQTCHCLCGLSSAYLTSGYTVVSNT